MDSVVVYMSVVAGIFAGLGLFVWYMARRQRLAEEAEEDARDASGHAAE